MTDEILKLAKECGFNDFGSAWYDARLEAFYNAAYNKAIEAVASAFEGQYTDSCPQRNIAKSIRELKKK